MGLTVFDTQAERYERWFERHPAVFASEVETIRPMIPRRGRGCEVGVGTGLFARALGVMVGIDPSAAMLEKAKARGIPVCQGYGHALPFPDGYFEYILMVTTICFLDDVERTLRECRRVLKSRASIIVALVDKESRIGKEYIRNRKHSVFYKHARFYSTREVMDFLEKARFTIAETRQNLFIPLASMETVQKPQKGHGHGSFIVIKAEKKRTKGRRRDTDYRRPG